MWPLSPNCRTWVIWWNMSRFLVVWMCATTLLIVVLGVWMFWSTTWWLQVYASAGAIADAGRVRITVGC
jgi:hypothetical protein